MNFVTLVNKATGHIFAVNADQIRTVNSDPSQQPPASRINFDHDHSILVEGSLSDVLHKLRGM